MEVFLLWLDDLDDLIGSVRLLWPALLSFICALALFVLTVFAVMQWPWLLATAAVLGIGLVLSRLIGQALAARLNTEP